MALRSQPPPAIFPILESEAEEEEGEEQAPLAARKPDVPRGTLYKSISHQRGGAPLVSPFADVTPATKSDDSPRASTESLEYEPPPGFNLAGNPHAPEYALRQRGEIYNRMGSQLLKMEQAYRASLHNVRSQCQATLKDAIGKVNKDNQRYDDWIISEAEERYQQLRKPLETVAEVSSTHLRRRQEEIQRLRYTCSRLYSVLARQGILSEEELRVAEAERAWVSDILSDYQSAIVDRDEEIQLLRHEVARLDALQDEFDRSLDRSAAFEKTVSPASAFPQKDADAQQIEQITQHYEEVIHNLEIVHAEEIASLIRKRDDVGAKWAVKIRSATRLKDDSGTLKVLHRQERLISLAQKMNRPRPLKDAETTAYISGVTLAMLLESQRHEDEKKAAEARAAETQAAEKRELKERMKRAHEELKRTQSRSNNKLDAVLRSRVASSVRGGMMRTSICGR
nr:hypothetical protein HK105_000939 [Polyrhizophydium stewartii]